MEDAIDQREVDNTTPLTHEEEPVADGEAGSAESTVGSTETDVQLQTLAGNPRQALTGPYMKWLVNYLKNQYPYRGFEVVDTIPLREMAMRQMRKHRMREAHIAQHIDMVVACVVTPSRRELRARAALRGRMARNRARAYRDIGPPTFFGWVRGANSFGDWAEEWLSRLVDVDPGGK